MSSAGAASDVTLVLMAGGRGSRLGGIAKGLLRREGRPLLAWQLEALAPLCGDVLLVTQEPTAYASFNLPSVRDAWPDKGPLGGLVTALGHVRTAFVLCVACDLPFVTAAVVEPLLAARAEMDAALYEVEGKLEPMLAVYGAHLLAELAAQLASPPSFRALLAGKRVCRLPGSAEVTRALANVNSTAELSLYGLELPDC